MRVRINGCLINLSALSDDELADLVSSISERERGLRNEASIALGEVRRRLQTRNPQPA